MYLRVGIYEKLVQKGCSKEKETDGQIKSLLGLDDESIDKFTPGLFWFSHNGVTIYIADEKINRCNAIVEFDAEKASVINGAQTMTNLYKIVNETKREILGLFENELADSIKDKKPEGISTKDYVEKTIDDICKSIYLKVIFIEGSKNFVKEISNGLNTQIPINQADILANAGIVESINEKLASENIRIVKEGEIENRNQVSVINFAKRYKIIQGKPGTSKNLNKNTLKAILEEVNSCDDNIGLAKKFRIVIDADEWWTQNNKVLAQGEVSEIESNICKYGRNYFESYVVLCKPDDTDEEVLANLYVEFVKFARLAKTEKTLKEFKKDTLFEEIINIRADNAERVNERDIKDVIYEKKQQLVEYLNINKKSGSMKKFVCQFGK